MIVLDIREIKNVLTVTFNQINMMENANSQGS